MLGITALLVTALRNAVTFLVTVTERRYFSAEVTSNVTALLFQGNDDKISVTRYPLLHLHGQAHRQCSDHFLRALSDIDCALKAFYVKNWLSIYLPVFNLQIENRQINGQPFTQK